MEFLVRNDAIDVVVIDDGEVVVVVVNVDVDAAVVTNATRDRNDRLVVLLDDCWIGKLLLFDN